MPYPALGSRATSPLTIEHIDHFAHNLRNALAASLGRIELLERRLRRDPVTEDDILESLAIAAREIRRADALLRSFENSLAGQSRVSLVPANGISAGEHSLTSDPSVA